MSKKNPNVQRGENLTDADRKRILDLYAKGYSPRDIEQRTPFTRRSIQMVLNPDSAQAMRRYYHVDAAKKKRAKILAESRRQRELLRARQKTAKEKGLTVKTDLPKIEGGNHLDSNQTA